jgi:glycerophosphoryl diester phosphodiesterase
VGGSRENPQEVGHGPITGPLGNPVTAPDGLVMKRRTLVQIPLAWTAAAAASAAEPSGGPRRPVDLQGHRGARGLLPESTLAGFERALSLGVTTLELDTGITADGVVVVHHDRALHVDHTRDAIGRFLEPPGALLNRLTLAELRQFDVGRARPGSRTAQTFPDQQAVDGQRIPTLGEVFELTRRLGADAVRFNVETKLSPLAPDDTPDPQTFARRVLAVMREHGVLERCTLQSFDWRTLRAARESSPGLATAHLTSQQDWGPGIDSGVWTDGFKRLSQGSAPRMVKAAGGSIWSPFFGDLRAEALAEAHELGLEVIVWTVNQPADIDRMLALGVDGLITDYPDRARAVMQARGLPLPLPIAGGTARPPLR